MTREVIVKTETTVSAEQAAVMLDNTNAAELIAQFNEAKAAIKLLTEQKEAAEKALKELMGDAQIGLIAGVERVKISYRNNTTINRKDLAEAFPEAYALCLETKPYPVLTAVS
jgi:predicted phage-related endonuclease